RRLLPRGLLPGAGDRTGRQAARGQVLPDRSAGPRRADTRLLTPRCQVRRQVFGSQGLAGLSWALTPETGESPTQPMLGRLGSPDARMTPPEAGWSPMPRPPRTNTVAPGEGGFSPSPSRSV